MANFTREYMIPNFQYPTPIDREVNWDKSKTIMSRTDAAGTIDYVNQVFCDVCGYSAEELLGSPHNIIRHPDMPRVIFKVLWDNIQQGINFHAVAKNLAKSGRTGEDCELSGTPYLCPYSECPEIYRSPIRQNAPSRSCRRNGS